MFFLKSCYSKKNIHSTSGKVREKKRHKWIAMKEEVSFIVIVMITYKHKEEKITLNRTGSLRILNRHSLVKFSLGRTGQVR